MLRELVGRLYKIVGESHPDSYLGFVSAPRTTPRLQICVVIQHLALPRSMIVAIEQISFIGWNSCIPRTFLFEIKQGKVGSSIQSINVFKPEAIRVTLSINKFYKFGRHVCPHFTA